LGSTGMLGQGRPSPYANDTPVLASSAGDSYSPLCIVFAFGHNFSSH